MRAPPGGVVAGRPEAAAMLLLLAVPAALLCAFLGNPALGGVLAVAALPALALLRGPGPGAGTHASTGAGATAAPATDGRGRLGLVVVLVALLLTTLGGEGRLLPATPDWLVRDAVLRDLVVQRWPFAYRVDGVDRVLRAPLGLYLLPALAGKLAGLRCAHLALWAQDTVALAAVLRVFCASASARRSLVVLAVFCVFGGWDMVGTLAVAARHTLGEGAPFAIPDDVQWWDRLFQYSSTLTLVLWVPHHALAGWFVTALLLLRERGRIRVGVLMAGAGLSIAWSPFAAMGAAPFLLKAGVEALRAREVRAADVAAPLLLGAAMVPVALYLASDGGGIARGFQPMNTEFLIRYPAFLALELLPFVAALALFPAGRADGGPPGRRPGAEGGDGGGAGGGGAEGKGGGSARSGAGRPAGEAGGTGPAGGERGPARSTCGLAVAVLVLIPFYRVGVSNDFAMRASIPALAILAVATGHGVVSALRTGGARRVVFVAVVAVGSLTGLEEVWHTLRTPNQGASTCDFVQAWDQSPYSRQMSDAIYLARREAVPRLLRAARPQVLVTGPLAGRCVDRRV